MGASSFDAMQTHAARLCLFSPPPCGEGPGVGVGRCGTSAPKLPDPPPRPSPTRGEGDSGVAAYSISLIYRDALKPHPGLPAVMSDPPLQRRVHKISRR